MSFPTGTEMFQFPAFALLILCIQIKSTCVTRLMSALPLASANSKTTTTRYQVGFPIRKSMDQRVLSPPHGLSQSATSFIASYRQGIHQTPFMRLIRSSKRKTRSGRGRIRNPVCPPSRWTSAPRRPFGQSGAWFHPWMYAQNSNGLYYWLSISQPPFSTNDGQLRSVYLDLERLLLPAGPHRATREQVPEQPKTAPAPTSPHAGKTNKSVSCFSLFTMSKTIKVQTNKFSISNCKAAQNP
jgi:hypothetical protein